MKKKTGIASRCDFVHFGLGHGPKFVEMLNDRAWSFNLVVFGDGPLISFRRTDVVNGVEIVTQIIVSSTAKTDPNLRYITPARLSLYWHISDSPGAMLKDSVARGEFAGDLDAMAVEIEAARRYIITERKRLAKVAA